MIGINMLMACHDSTTSPADNYKIRLIAPKPELWVEDTLQILATVTTEHDTEVDDATLTWSSSTPELLQVSQSGIVTALGSGKAMITAIYENATASLDFDIYRYALVYENAVNNQPRLVLLELTETALPEAILGINDYAYEGTASPDGARLGYVSIDDISSQNIDLYLLDWQTGGHTRLTIDSEIDDMPAWSPDGTSIAFRSYMEQKFGDIVIYHFEDGSLTNLTPDPQGVALEERQPAWSPGGSKIAYSSNATGNMDLWLMNADGSNKRKLTDTEHYDTEAVWSPDGTRILFRRNYATESDLIWFEIETGFTNRITLPGYQRMPAISPDGRWVALVSHTGLYDTPQIYLMSPDGSELRLITREESWNGGQNPSFIRLQ